MALLVCRHRRRRCWIRHRYCCCYRCLMEEANTKAACLVYVLMLRGVVVADRYGRYCRHALALLRSARCCSHHCCCNRLLH